MKRKIRPGAIKRWHRQISRLPDLLAHDGEDQHLVCRKIVRLRQTADKPLVSYYGFLAIGIAALIIFVPPFGGLSFSTRLGLFFAAVQIIAIYEVYTLTFRMISDYNIANPLFRLLKSLERNSENWDNFHYRVYVVRRIEVTARRLERIPASSGISDPYVLSHLIKLSSECAASLRQLQGQVIMPGSDRVNIISKELASRLLLLIDGRWYELPRTDISIAQKLVDEHRKQKRGKMRIAISLAAALLLFGVAAAVVTQLDETIAGLLTPFVISSAVTILAAAGIELKALSESTDVVQQAVKDTTTPPQDD
jgi:hypothetical protein